MQHLHSISRFFNSTAGHAFLRVGSTECAGNVSNIFKPVRTQSRGIVSEIKARYGPDMPDICSFTQELSLWKQMWTNQNDPPDSLSATLLDKRVCPTVFPNTIGCF